MKTKTQPVFLRTSQTQRLVFPGKPSADIRRALRLAGFRWNGALWFRTTSETVPIKDRDLADLLVPTDPQPEPSVN